MLVLENLRKSFDGHLVLDHIDLKVAGGEIVSILGRPGSGKTTLLNLILGVYNGDCGNIIIDGYNIIGVPPEERPVNVVFRDFDFLWDMNVYKNIISDIRYRPISSMSDVNEIVQLLGLEDFLTKKITQLSGEQRLKVAVARIMTTKPKVLLLDAPFEFLERSRSDEVRESIKKLVRHYHLCALVTASKYTDVCAFGDRIVVLENGCISSWNSSRGGENERRLPRSKVRFRHG